MSLDLETSEIFIGQEMISKGSRFGVGSLIVSKAFRGPPSQSVEFHAILFDVLLRRLKLILIRAVLFGENNIIDNEYTLLFQQGVERGLEYFFDEYYGALCLYAERLCNDEGFAAEMASEAFYKTWQQRAQFTSPDHIVSYLYKVVKNGCYHFRVKKNKQAITPSTPQDDKTAYEAIVFAETIRQLHSIITTLPQQCSAVLQSLYIEGKSVAETAKEMQLTISTIKSHKKNGLDTLRRKFRDGLISVLLLFLSATF